ncbi:uncharacterized protein BX663DRAFT_430145, partial [Cokeromyces recurvatus]|uniref:uncharacterized protein n=1 Tax=Cokeromyces recurvatus TaxID=90255 RepID=UPI00221F29AB
KYPSYTRQEHIVSVWSVRWLEVCTILYEMDYLFHEQVPLEIFPLDSKLTIWLHRNPPS